MQPVLLSSLAERPHTCRVISQQGLPAIARRSGEAGGREWQSLQLRLPSGAVASEIEGKKHFTGQA